MPPPTAAGITIAEMTPRVDFAAYWRMDRTVRYAYRVPSHQFLLVERHRIAARTPAGEVVAGPGDLLCLRRLPRNEYGFSGEAWFWELHASFAPPPRAGEPLLIEGEPLPWLVRLGPHAERARGACEALGLAIDRPGDAARLAVRAAMAELLLCVVAALGRAPARRREDPWQRARAQLDADLEQPLRLAAVARALAVGEDHFIRGFRKRFGVSPMAYRAQARLRWAAGELAVGRSSVKEVAHRLGFQDASAFARAFRRQFGLPPSEWRVANEHGWPKPSSPAEEAPLPLNRHLRPPGSGEGPFTWG